MNVPFMFSTIAYPQGTLTGVSKISSLISSTQGYSKQKRNDNNSKSKWTHKTETDNANQKANLDIPVKKSSISKISPACLLELKPYVK